MYSVANFTLMYPVNASISTALSYFLKGSFILSQKFFPRRRLQSHLAQKAKAFVEALPCIIARFFNKEMVL